MTDNGGGRDSGGGASWFKPSEDRHLRQSEYEDPLEGREPQSETVFPDSGGYAGLSSSRPALADPYPEALGGPPAEPPNPLSYPGAGEAAYRPLTRIPGEGTDPRTQEIPALGPDSEPLWTGAPAPGGDRAPGDAGGTAPGYPAPAWEADGAHGSRGGDAATGEMDLREAASSGYPTSAWDADTATPGHPAPAWDADASSRGAADAPAAGGAAPRDDRSAAWDADQAYDPRGGDLRDAAPGWNAGEPYGAGDADLRGDRDASGGGGAPWGADADLRDDRAPAWDSDTSSRGAADASWTSDAGAVAGGSAPRDDRAAAWDADEAFDTREAAPGYPGSGQDTGEAYGAAPRDDRSAAWDTDASSRGAADASWTSDAGAVAGGAAPRDDRAAAWDADEAFDTREAAPGHSASGWDTDLRDDRAPAWDADASSRGAADAPWAPDAGAVAGGSAPRDDRAAAWDADEAFDTRDAAPGRSASGWDADPLDGRDASGHANAPWEGDRAPAWDADTSSRGAADTPVADASWASDAGAAAGDAVPRDDRSAAWDADQAYDPRGGDLRDAAPGWNTGEPYGAGDADLRDGRDTSGSEGAPAWGADASPGGLADAPWAPDAGGAVPRDDRSAAWDADEAYGTRDGDLRDAAPRRSTSGWDADEGYGAGDADLRGDRDASGHAGAPWDGDGAYGDTRPGGAPTWGADAAPHGGSAALSDELGPWNPDDRGGSAGPRDTGADPLGDRSYAWDADEDLGRGAGPVAGGGDLRDDRGWGADPLAAEGGRPGADVDPLTDDSYGVRDDDRGPAWGPESDPLNDDRGTGWGEDPLGDDRPAEAGGEADPWAWSRDADSVPGPVRVPDSREERASAPWTDVPEPDAWEGDPSGGTGNTWAFDRDDPRLPEVVREAERRRREESAAEAPEDPLAAIADMQARAADPGATQMIAPVEEEAAQDPEYDDGFTPADYGMPDKPKAKKRKKDPIAEEFPGFEDRPLGGEAGDPYPGYDSVDFLADTDRGAVATLWLGIASLIPGVGLVTALLALLVTGPRAKRAIRGSNGTLDGLGFITGGTVFAVLGILVTVISVAIWLVL